VYNSQRIMAYRALAIFIGWFCCTAATGATPDGASLYARYCAVCHGERGDGASRARAGLVPPPRDFTEPGLGARLDRARMQAAVRDGVAGTAMVGWRSQLSEVEIAAVVDFVATRLMRPLPSNVAGRSGAEIYAFTCSVCHGEDGAGALWGRESLRPAPVNFREADPAAFTRERMIASVLGGRPGTAMAAFAGQLSADDAARVVDYVRSSFMGAGARIAPVAATTVGRALLGVETASTPPVAIGPAPDVPMPLGLTGDAIAGGRFFQDNCAVCHGAAGDGQGPRAYFIFPKPRNFMDPAARGRLTRPALFSAIRGGVPGREMPAWGKVLTDGQIADVAEYVYQAFVRPQ